MTKMRSVLAVLLVFLFISVSNSAGQQLMSLDELETLLDVSPSHEVKAYFESVPEGTRIKKYNIVIKGVAHLPGKNIIIFKTKYKIAAGMSGSPVYVNDKLVGAMGYSVGSFNFENPSLGGISPISHMMEESRSGYSGDIASPQSFNYDGMLFTPIAVGNQQVLSLKSGAFDRFIISSSVAGGENSGTLNNPVLKAGMPIVVDLLEWIDENGKVTTISAMGTITYVGKDGKVFAFGHPFLGNRNVIYSFRTAEVMLSNISEFNSFKMVGKTSDVIGAITYDSTYGIYGVASTEKLSKLHRFGLEFKTNGVLAHKFNIKVADSVLTPILAESVFGYIGEAYGAPLPEEPSVSQLESKVELEGHKPVIWKELFASSASKFGPGIIYASSFENAYKGFFSGVYGNLYYNRYGLKISGVSVSMNFIPGRSRTFKLDRYKFPNKVVWGENPTLQLSLVSQDNNVTISKGIKVNIDWEKVERPVYAKDTLNTDKVSEKVVSGYLAIESGSIFFQTLSDSERQKLLPEYFLGPDDFLENLSGLLNITNQKIYAKVSIKSKSGLFDKDIAGAEDIISSVESSGNDDGWQIGKGLVERKLTVEDERFVYFYIDLPPVPSGYVVDYMIRKNVSFEIVLE